MSSPSLEWNSVAISSSGQYQTATYVNFLYDTGGIYTSNDYGSTWTQSSAPLYYWTCVALSSSGQYQTATYTNPSSSYSGAIYTSNDYGSTWSLSTSPTDLNYVAISSSGQYQVVSSGNLGNGGMIYVSGDYGYSWNQNTSIPNLPWICVAMSSSGQYLTTCNYSFLYTCKNIIDTGGGGSTNYWSLNSSTGPTYTLSPNTALLPGASGATIEALAFINTSDYRIKEKVTSLSNEYNVDNLNPVEYYNTITNKKDIGFLAHEVQEHFPFLVNGNKDDDNYQSLNYISLIPLLVKEIHDLKKRIKILEKDNF